VGFFTAAYARHQFPNVRDGFRQRESREITAVRIVVDVVSGEESSKEPVLEGFARTSNGKRTETRQMFLLLIETVAAMVGRAS
jgi:hypothetical protein